MPPYNVTKDQATCAPGGKAPLQETLLVDSGTGGIKNVAIYLRDASRVHDSAKPSADNVLFDQKVCVFLTHVCAVTVGQTLDIKNSDNVGHNTNIAGKKNTFNQTIPAGATIAYKVQKEEATPAPVNCSIHPWMVGVPAAARERLLRGDHGRRLVRDRQPAGRREARHPGLARKRGRARRRAGRHHAGSQGARLDEQGPHHDHAPAG